MAFNEALQPLLWQSLQHFCWPVECFVSKGACFWLQALPSGHAGCMQQQQTIKASWQHQGASEQSLPDWLHRTAHIVQT